MIATIEHELRALVNQPDYPCIAAKAAFARGEFRIQHYQTLGSGLSAERLGDQLIEFKNDYFRERTQYLTFIASFDGEFKGEKEFEDALWKELSFVSSHPKFSKMKWDPAFSDHPEDKNFCFSLDGSAFFIVGMHPQSSRLSRKTSRPILLFNLYQQFEALDEETQFYPMVRTNRKRDIRFQGSVNPMVEKYAEKWEAIQFSGRNNSSEWKCPFKKLIQAFS